MEASSPKQQDDLSLEDFTAQVSIIRQLIRALISGTWQLLKRSWIIVLVLMLVCGAAGFALKRTVAPSYSASMTVAFKYLTKKMYADMLAKANGMLASGNREAFAEMLQVSPETAAAVNSILSYNLPGEPLYMDLNNERMPFTISVSVNDPAVLPALQEGLIHYMEHSPFVQQELALNMANKEAQMQHFTTQKAWVDSVKTLYIASLSGEPTSVPLSLSEVLEQSNTLFSKIEEIRRDKEQNWNIMVMDGFVAGAPTSPGGGGNRTVLMGLIIGFLLGFVVAFVRGPAEEA